MKRLSLLILSLIILDVSWALSPTMLELSTHSGEVVCDDCSGTLKFAWHMEDNDSTPDVTIGNPCGCSDGDSIGAEIGSPDFSSTQKSDGLLSLHINALDENYLYSVNNYNILDMRDIKVTFDIYVVSWPSSGNNIHFIFSDDNFDNNITFLLRGAGELIRVNLESGATIDYIESSSSIATGSWVSCEYQAKGSTAGNDHYLACTGVAAVEEDDDFVAYTGDGDGGLQIGDQYGNSAAEYYLDNIKISVSDRF